MTEFSLLVHVSTNLQSQDVSLHPRVCTVSACVHPERLYEAAGTGALVSPGRAPVRGRLPGPQRAPSPWREEGAKRWGDLGGATRDASEQVENRQFTLSRSPRGWRERGAEQRSDNNEKQRRIE